jgi:hypothetical protein
MTKKPATPPIPALSLQHAHQLEAVEHNFYQAIESCIDGYGSIMHELKADMYTRSYVVKFFSIYIDAYKNFAVTSLPLWIPDLKVKSIEWVIMALGNYRGVQSEKLREYFVNLNETLDEHLKNTFGSSKNPLLAALANPNAASSPKSSPANNLRPPPNNSLDTVTTNSPRRDFVQPILETKGWSIEDWAIESKVAYHTAADYLSGRTNPYASSRVKLAKSLGVPVQQLPR